MKRHSSSGVTLLEVLVSVSIIAILMTLLLPALKQGAQLSKSAACVSNLRLSTMAMISYAGDYDDYLTPFQDVSYNWYQVYGGNWSGPPGTANDGCYYWYRLLRHYNYSAGTFMCPAGTNISWYNHPSPPPTNTRPWDATFTIYPYQTTDHLAWYLEDRDGETPPGPSPDRTNYGAAASYSGTGWNFNTSRASASGIQWVTLNHGRMGIQEMLPMINFWPYDNDANSLNYAGSTPAGHTTAEVLTAIRKPTLLSAYRPANTAVIFDGLFNFRFDKNFWGYINLRHYNNTSTNFSFMDGSAQTRDWTRMPPGIRTGSVGAERYLPSDPIPNPGLYGSINQLRNLLGTALDGTALTSPRVQHGGIRFIVPKVEFNDSAGQPAGD